MDCPYPYEKSQETTSFPGFSPTRPYGASRTEPGNQVFTRKSSLMYTWRKERTATSSPGLFPQKIGGAGGAGKRPWHRLVTCAYQIFISTVMYEFLWSILHPHWLTAFQKNTLVYWFVINFPERWSKSPRKTRHSGCVERAKFWKLTRIYGGINC